MHKKVHSLLITGVLSANIVGSTVSVFADETPKKSNNTKIIEEVVKPTEEDIEWQKTTQDNYQKLWEVKDEGNTIVLTKYKESNDNQFVEIPRMIGNKKVKLQALNNEVFPDAVCIKVAEGTQAIKLSDTNLENAFSGNKNLEYLDLRGIDVSKVTNLSQFVSNCTNLEHVNLSGWNVSKVKDLSGFFVNDTSLESIDLSGWNVSKVTDLCGFLANANVLESVNLSGWNVSNVTDMSYLFYGLNSLKNLDISGWETSNKLKDTEYMFYGCSNLTNINLNGFNMDNVINAESMFEKCSSLTDIKGTENWTLKKVRKIGRIFKETKLNFIDLSSVNLSSIYLTSKNMKDMFSDTSCKSKNLLVVTDSNKLKLYNYIGDGRIAFNLTFKANEGMFKDNVQKKTINTVTISPSKAEILLNPIRDGYTFDGWEKVNNKTLNAKWYQVALDGTANDNIMIDPEEILPSIYTLIDRDVVDIIQRGNGKEYNPVVLEAKDVNKAQLKNFLTKLDSLNANVSTIKRGNTTTEYNMTVDNKNITDFNSDKITNLTLRVNNRKISLLKEASRYSRSRNCDVKIPIIVKFKDVKSDFWAKANIEEFASMGIINGYPNREFKPNDSITRAEFVKIINNVFGYTKAANYVKFKDVPEDSFYYNDIAIGIEKGYINGRTQTTFAPNDNITREEVATILTKIMKNKDENIDRLNNFHDGNQTSDWAKPYVEGAIKAGYLIGDDQKNINPTKNMTRAEAVTVLSRLKNIK